MYDERTPEGEAEMIQGLIKPILDHYHNQMLIGHLTALEEAEHELQPLRRTYGRYRIDWYILQMCLEDAKTAGRTHRSHDAALPYYEAALRLCDDESHVRMQFSIEGMELFVAATTSQVAQ